MILQWVWNDNAVVGAFSNRSASRACTRDLLSESYNICSTLNIQAGLLVFGATGEDIEGADVASAVGPRHVFHGDGRWGEGRLGEEHFVLEGSVHLLAKALAVRGQVLNMGVLWALLPCDLLYTCGGRAQSVNEANGLHWIPMMLLWHYTRHNSMRQVWNWFSSQVIKFAVTYPCDVYKSTLTDLLCVSTECIIES